MFKCEKKYEMVFIFLLKCGEVDRMIGMLKLMRTPSATRMGIDRFYIRLPCGL